MSKRSRISEGLLWAAELNVTRATLRTLRSGSSNVFRKSPRRIVKNREMTEKCSISFKSWRKGKKFTVKKQSTYLCSFSVRDQSSVGGLK